MKTSFIRRACLGGVAFFALALVGAPPALAEEYPSRAVTLVVPFTPGGVTDNTARTVAKRLGERLGQPVIVENRPGGGTSVATAYVARAKPDGYTLLYGSRVTQITNPLINKTQVPTEKDFAPIYTVCDVDAVMVANASRPYKTIKELIAYARANPGKVNFATPGNGTAAHLAATVFMDLTKTQMTHVPYKGSAPALQDLLGGQVDIAFDYPSSTVSFIKAGSLTPLAALSTARLAALPDVPTIAEAGVPGAQTDSWFAIFAPGQTPASVVDRLVAEMARVMQEPEVRQKLIDAGTVPRAVGGKELQQLIERETVRWRDVVAKSGIVAN
jgi:tripartite-type tricarboxylate transporter receptor subunit TctC